MPRRTSDVFLLILSGAKIKLETSFTDNLKYTKRVKRKYLIVHSHSTLENAYFTSWSIPGCLLCIELFNPSPLPLPQVKVSTEDNPNIKYLSAHAAYTACVCTTNSFFWDIQVSGKWEHSLLAYECQITVNIRIDQSMKKISKKNQCCSRKKRGKWMNGKWWEAKLKGNEETEGAEIKGRGFKQQPTLCIGRRITVC